MKLYILVREDLDPSYRMVQGMHAAAEVVNLFPEVYGPNKCMPFVCLIVKDQSELYRWAVRIQKNCDTWFQWTEPDLDNQLTSVACMTRGGRIFKNLQLA